MPVHKQIKEIITFTKSTMTFSILQSKKSVHILISVLVSYIILLFYRELMTAKAAKQHEALFHDNTNYVMLFLNICLHLGSKINVSTNKPK